MPKQTINSDIEAAARISPGTWALIVTLIAALAGWGLSTRANSQELKDQKQQVTAELDKKVNKSDLDALKDSVTELRKDIRELRDILRSESRYHRRDK